VHHTRRVKTPGWGVGRGEGFWCLLTETGSNLGNRGNLTTTSFFVWNIIKVSGALFAVEDLQMNTVLSEIKKWNTKVKVKFSPLQVLEALRAVSG
jgi:hypothetical protein